MRQYIHLFSNQTAAFSDRDSIIIFSSPLLLIPHEAALKSLELTEKKAAFISLQGIKVKPRRSIKISMQNMSYQCRKAHCNSLIQTQKNIWSSQ